jgi:Domain of unknown function (DUF4397)
MKARLLGMALLATLTLAACGDDDNTPAPTGAVRAIHFSPDAPAVDIKVDGTQVLSGVTYLTASGYLEVPAGDRTFRVEAVGSDAAAIEATVPVAANTQNTLIAINDVANIEPLYLTDDNTAPATGFARVRVIHGAPGVGAVDVYFTTPGGAFGAASLTNFDFGSVSTIPTSGGGTSNYIQVPAGTYRVAVVPAGGDPAADAVIDQEIAVPAGAVATAIAGLDVEGTAPGIKVYVDNAD